MSSTRVCVPLRRVVYASTSGTVAVSADSSFVATGRVPLRGGRHGRVALLQHQGGGGEEGAAVGAGPGAGAHLHAPHAAPGPRCARGAPPGQEGDRAAAGGGPAPCCYLCSIPPFSTFPPSSHCKASWCCARWQLAIPLHGPVAWAGCVGQRRGQEAELLQISGRPARPQDPARANWRPLIC